MSALPGSGSFPMPQTIVPSVVGGPHHASYLVPVAGPARPAMELDSRRAAGGPPHASGRGAVAGPARPAMGRASRRAAGGLILGRNEACDLHLPGGEQVSRRHACFRFVSDGEPGEREGTWYLSDAGSGWGT